MYWILLYLFSNISNEKQTNGNRWVLRRYYFDALYNKVFQILREFAETNIKHEYNENVLNL